MLICRVLGPLEVVSGATRVAVGGPQPRRLIQALVLARGEPVPEAQLAEAIWGNNPPAGPAASLQAYVSRLRKVLGAEALTRGPGGYALVARSDVAEFESLLATARSAARPADALPVLTRALELWRGRPYPDLEAYGDVVRHQLTENHATAVEDRAAALLGTGDAPAAVAELRPAVRADPYRERRWELLILGLYRSARQAEALAALREVRALLADDLGVDPGPELQNLERRLLAQDPSLLLSVTTSPPAPRRPLTRFVGRDSEQALLTTTMKDARLVTLVGPGGAGKTRLALEWAGPAPLARLADVHSPLDLPSVVAGALGLAETPPRFNGLEGLLVLDNCEHLTEAVADLVVALLADNPALRVLATSREALAVDGEHLLPVEPLSRADAVLLLTDRIRALRPGWQPGEAERDQLDRLAAALDGIPLALELAAARARVLSLEELLGSRFPAQGKVPRGALTPHATLEATVAWSVNLLPERDRAMLLRLWPFEGGFTLEAAEAVGCDLAGLSSLVARSVVSADTTDTPSRYRLLEIIRGYCRERDPDPAGSRAAHATWVRELVEKTVPDLRGSRSARSTRVLNRELPNIRAGLAHDLTADPSAALRSAGLLEWFWLRGAHIAEGHRLLDQASENAPEAPVNDRARALVARGVLHWISADLSVARELTHRAMDLLGEAEDLEGRQLLCQLLYYDALLWNFLGDYDQAVQSARSSLALAEATGEAWFGALPQVMLGAALAARGERAEGHAVLREAIGLARRHGYDWAGGFGSLVLARSLLADDPVGALGPLQDAIGFFREQEDVGNLLACVATGASARLRLGHPLDAAVLYAASYRHAALRGIRLDNADPAVSVALHAEMSLLSPEVHREAGVIAAGLDEEAMVALVR